MENKDPKNIIIAILVLVVLVLGVLYIMELNKPDSLESYQQALTEQQQAISESCTDLSTEGGRETCFETLRNLSGVLDEIKGEEATTTPDTGAEM